MKISLKIIMFFLCLSCVKEAKNINNISENMQQDCLQQSCINVNEDTFDKELDEILKEMQKDMICRK